MNIVTYKAIAHTQISKKCIFSYSHSLKFQLGGVAVGLSAGHASGRLGDRIPAATGLSRKNR